MPVNKRNPGVYSGSIKRFFHNVIYIAIRKMYDLHMDTETHALFPIVFGIVAAVMWTISEEHK